MRENDFSVNTEIFVMPHKERFILYSPLQGAVAEANEALIKGLKDLKDGKQTLSDSDIEKLVSLGFVNSEDKLPSIAKEEYAPAGAVFLLTHKCNLRCDYCYSRGGERKETLETAIAEKAVDFAVNNALEKGVETLNLLFHGGGEPTIAWKELTHIHGYALQTAEKNNLKTIFNISTNGIMSNRKVEWLAENIDNIQLSFDGIFQHKQRTFVNKKDSTGIVFRTAKRLDELEKSYALRATVYPQDVPRLGELIDYFSQNFKSRNIDIALAISRGNSRCPTKSSTLDYDVFRAKIRQLVEIGESQGIYINKNRLPVDKILSIHCGGCGTNFIVTPTGEVTTCFEIDSPSNKYSDIFIIGRFDQKTKEFIFDEDKIRYLRSRQVQNIDGCDDCFVKWHCAGGCPIDTLDEGSFYSTRNLTRCDYVRGMGKVRLLDVLKSQTKT